MIKIILPDDSSRSEPMSALVPVHTSGRLDGNWLTKRAGADFFRYFDSVKPRPDHSLIHLIAMGASDSYGPNRNGDSFPRTHTKIALENPNWDKIKLANGSQRTKSASTFKDSISSGLLERYKTFEKYANVYKHHKNKPAAGDKIWGSVKAAAFNEPMDRVELLIEVNNNEWAADLEKLANNESVPFSMACIVNPASLITTSTGYKPITSVHVGDLVLTHKNRWKKVTSVTRNNYTGTVFAINVEGLPFSLELTANHPMLVLSPKPLEVQAVADDVNEEAFAPREMQPQWKTADKLTKEDYLLYLPTSEYPNYSSVENPHIGAAIGEVISDIERDEVTRSLLHEFIGTTGSPLYLGMFASPEIVRAAFIGALLEGNNVQRDDGQILWMHEDLYMVLYLRDLLMSLDIPSQLIAANLNKDMSDGTSVVVSGFVLTINNSDVARLAEFSSFAEELYDEVNGSVNGVTPRDDLYIPVKITAISIGQASGVETYNIEVEDDHSYVVNSVVSHNCKVPYDVCAVCGNAAKTRDEYCEHLTDNNTALLKSGQIISAFNESPTFFDISRVNRPADRIAWSLTKAASELVRAADLVFDPEFAVLPPPELVGLHSPRMQAKMATYAKAAEMEKKVPLVAKLKGGVVPTSKKENNLPTTPLSKVGQVIDELHSNLTCLPLGEFAALVFGNTEKTAAIVKEASQYLPKLFEVTGARDNGYSISANANYDATSPIIYRSMSKTAKDLSSVYSLETNAVRLRSIENSIKLASSDSVRMVPNTQPSAEAQQLLSQYAGYKLAFLQHVQDNRPKDFDAILQLSIAQNHV